ncbi:hypothetical protein ACFQ14_08475 [Pseudahrensia aquimaris]|uniref:Uncharacterized protein n=1 Tax=Pseudahrensia aquimaris TaxID=744461 RepID=A0ABW3FI05_9HYPH
MRRKHPSRAARFFGDTPEDDTSAPPQRKMSERQRAALRDEHWSWLRMIMVQTAWGGAIGILIGYLIIHHDVRRIGTMIEKSDQWLLFTFLLLFSFASLIGSIAGGIAIWLRAEKEARDHM